MFTPLNLGFDGSLQPDQRFLPAAGNVSSGSSRTTSFAISLDTSVRAQTASGETLPPDGGTLPPALDLSLQVAAIEQRLSGAQPGGHPEWMQHMRQQSAQQSALTAAPDAVAVAGPDDISGPEALAAALEFIQSGGRGPENAVTTDTAPGEGRARTLPGEAAPVSLPTAATPDRSALPQSVPVASPARLTDAGERRAPATLSAAPTHPGTVATPADSLESVVLTTADDAVQDSRVAELRLSQLAPDPVLRPAVGTGPAVDLPVELPVYRPAAAALPETTAAAATESTALTGVGSAESAHRAPSRPTALPPIATPVGQSDWGESLSERVLVMTSGKLGNAEIRLTPAELGPVRVQVSVDDGTATVSFQASHAATRDAIEQALPRLRDMLTENGLSLGQASVGDQGVHDGSREATDDPTGAGSALPDTGDEPVAELIVEAEAGRVSSALVDTFA